MILKIIHSRVDYLGIFPHASVILELFDEPIIPGQLSRVERNKILKRDKTDNDIKVILRCPTRDDYGISFTGIIK